MCRFAAADPFTIRAGLFVVLRRDLIGVAGRFLARTGFFRVTRFFRLVVARRFFGRNSDLVASVCSAQP